MKAIITKHELWNLSNEQIGALTKGRLVKIVLNNGQCKNAVIRSLLLASNPPHLFCGFLTEDNHHIYLRDIDHVEL